MIPLTSFVQMSILLILTHIYTEMIFSLILCWVPGQIPKLENILDILKIFFRNLEISATVMSILDNNTEYVHIDGISSEQLPITCGVPQGSILGPLLFLIYMNDIPSASDIFKFILFADDTSLKSFISNHVQQQSHIPLIMSFSK